MLPAHVPRALHHGAAGLGQALIEHRGRGRELTHGIAAVAHGRHDHLVGAEVPESQDGSHAPGQGGVQVLFPRNVGDGGGALCREGGKKQHFDIIAGEVNGCPPHGSRHRVRGRLRTKNDARRRLHAPPFAAGHMVIEPPQGSGEAIAPRQWQPPQQVLERPPDGPQNRVSNDAHSPEWIFI